MLGFEVSPIVQYVIAFAIIAALLALFAVVLRRIGGKRFAMTGQERGRGRQPRLGIVDVYDLDRQRQLVLLRRDNVEHLVMLGGPNDLVVESNIVRVPIGRAPVSEMPNERLEPGQEQGRALPEPIAASAGVPMPSPMPGSASGANAARAPLNGNAAREPEALRREPLIQQRPQPAQPAAPPQRQQPPMAERQAAPPAAPPQKIQRSAPPVASAPQNIAPANPTPLTPAASAPAPASPLADLDPLLRARPRPTEPVAPTPAAEPKRSLFGFGRPAEAPPAAPAFPTRPRATPVASDFTSQRTAPKFAPAGDGMQASPAAAPDSASAGVNFAGQPLTAEKPAEMTAEKPAVQPKPGRPLDDAILADMAKQLETALARPKPPAPTPPYQSPPAPSEAIDGPSEPKTYNPVSSPASSPVTSAAAAAATVAAGASVFRSASSETPSSAAPSSPVPPRPYGGEQPARSDSAPIEEQESESEIDRGEADVAEKAVAPSSSAEPIEAEKPQEDARAPWPEADEAADVAFKAEPELSDEPDLDAAPEARPEAVGSMTESASEENVFRETRAEETQAEETSPHEQMSEEHASEERPLEEPSPVKPEAADEPQPVAASEEQRKEPAPAVIDPFSVDEIEAEFARLLGRSVDKDPKSP